MQNVTTGVAIPSLSPLSTLSTLRTPTGSRSSAMTEALNAASVGARLAAIKPASATGKLGNTTIATAMPATIERGSPIPSRREVRGRSCRAAATGTADASANSSKASVISARWCTVELSMSTLTIPQLEFASSNPATRKTNGPVRLRAASHSDKTAHAKSTSARVTSVASFICAPLPVAVRSSGHSRTIVVQSRPSWRARSTASSRLDASSFR